MAFVTTHVTEKSNPFAGILKSIATRYAKHRLFVRTVNELSALSAYDLADLGIDRSQIKSISYQAAYHG